ncbi:M15 family metallopeptidase [Isoptericola halotolerans]|uniref:M15 family metallopeptidase n=1 Tax=Isoptericola halotolerans TaxID=300560 RepID=UPI00388FFF08
MKHAQQGPSPTGTRRSRRDPVRGRHVAEKPRRRSSAAPRATLSLTAAAALVIATGGTYLAEAGPVVRTTTTDDGATTTRAPAPVAQAAPTAPAAPAAPAVQAAPAVPGAAATRAARQAPAVTVDRDLAVSRTDERVPRKDRAIQPAPEPTPENPPGCETPVQGGWSNGRLPGDQLCAPWDGAVLVRADVARSLVELNDLYTARFGEPMCITDGYRSYDQQVATKAAKGYLAATPGTSNHGWGLAVDLCPETYAGERGTWLHEHAPALGWVNPDWAQPGGSKPEPWHWESTLVP